MSFSSLGKKSNGSFLSLIKFLQSSLKLEHVELNGNFCNHWDEGRVMNWKKKLANDEECLNSGIERFIVHGGSCPLEAPDKEVLVMRTTTGDTVEMTRGVMRLDS